MKKEEPQLKLRTMHFDDSRWERMREAAKKDGRSISGWLRFLVDKALNKINTH